VHVTADENKRPYAYWREKDLAVLRQFYPSVENERIALLLGRSVASVISKAHRIGLRKSRHFISLISRDNVLRRYDDRVAS